MYRNSIFCRNTILQAIIYAFIVLSILLTACDSSDDIPVQNITDKQTLSDTELKKLQTRINSSHLTHNNRLHHDSETIHFGFDLRSSPQEDAAQYLPFLDYLEEATGYHFKLHFTPKNSTAVKDLGNTTTQLAAIGATSFIEAQAWYGAVSVARGLNHQNKAEYQSMFVVHPNSKIQTIHDIKGKRLAFGSIDSTQGHLIPRIMLTEHGISLNDLKTYDYTGSHQNCAEAVVAKRFDVCGMQDQLAKALERQGLVKIIHASDYYPSSGIAASKQLSAQTIEKIKAALLAFEPNGKHKEGLYNWDNTEMPHGFTTANADDYAVLKNWAIKFGFIKPNVLQGSKK